jgi:coenzyme F420-dependent glucose-6-phosphate dehydrogenase
LKLGFKASAEQFAPSELLEYSVLAEEVGFDSVWISDHFQPWRHTGGHAPFSLAWLGALGARTHRIIMGTSVLTPTFRYHPSVVAQGVRDLGLAFPRAGGARRGDRRIAQRSTVLGPQVAGTKGADSAIPGSHSADQGPYGPASGSASKGEFYKTELATIYDRPAKAVPIFIAGAGPFMAKAGGLGR